MKKLFLFPLAALLFAACSVNTSPTGGVVEEDLGIVIESPMANEVVSSPLIVSGQARGPWYFEASFPVSLEDESGEVIAFGLAVAQSEWTTPDFVDFEVTLDFATKSETGTLIFNNDNASGLPENDISFSVPVRFVEGGDSDQSLVEAYVRDNISEITPTEPALGGSWYVVEIEFEGEDGLRILAEDGHIQSNFSAKYSVTASGEVKITDIVNQG